MSAPHSLLLFRRSRTTPSLARRLGLCASTRCSGRTCTSTPLPRAPSSLARVSRPLTLFCVAQLTPVHSPEFARCHSHMPLVFCRPLRRHVGPRLCPRLLLRHVLVDPVRAPPLCSRSRCGHVSDAALESCDPRSRLPQRAVGCVLHAYGASRAAPDRCQTRARAEHARHRSTLLPAIALGAGLCTAAATRTSRRRGDARATSALRQGVHRLECRARQATTGAPRRALAHR